MEIIWRKLIYLTSSGLFSRGFQCNYPFSYRLSLYMNQVLSEGLAYMLVYHLIGNQKINNSISEFSDDQVKSHVTKRQRRYTYDRVLKIGSSKKNNNAAQVRWERDKQWHDLRESAGEWAGDIFLVMSYYFKILSSSMTIEILFTFKELCWFQ